MIAFFRYEIYKTTFDILKKLEFNIAWIADKFKAVNIGQIFTLVVTTDLISMKKYKNNIKNVILCNGAVSFDYKPTIKNNFGDSSWK